MPNGQSGCGERETNVIELEKFVPNSNHYIVNKHDLVGMRTSISIEEHRGSGDYKRTRIMYIL